MAMFFGSDTEAERHLIQSGYILHKSEDYFFNNHTHARIVFKKGKWTIEYRDGGHRYVRN